MVLDMWEFILNLSVISSVFVVVVHDEVTLFNIWSKICPSGEFYHWIDISKSFFQFLKEAHFLFSFFFFLRLSFASVITVK